MNLLQDIIETHLPLNSKVAVVLSNDGHEWHVGNRALKSKQCVDVLFDNVAESVVS